MATSVNFGLSDKQRLRDQAGGSWLRPRCASCGLNWFARNRDAELCEVCRPGGVAELDIVAAAKRAM